MKTMQCDAPTCTKMIEVPDDYEPEICCVIVSIEYPCGCGGYPLNPMFCDECELDIWGEPIEE